MELLRLDPKLPFKEKEQQWEVVRPPHPSQDLLDPTQQQGGAQGAPAGCGIPAKNPREEEKLHLGGDTSPALDSAPRITPDRGHGKRSPRVDSARRPTKVGSVRAYCTVKFGPQESRWVNVRVGDIVPAPVDHSEVVVLASTLRGTQDVAIPSQPISLERGQGRVLVTNFAHSSRRIRQGRRLAAVELEHSILLESDQPLGQPE